MKTVGSLAHAAAMLARAPCAQRLAAPPQAFKHFVHPKGVCAERLCDLRLGQRSPLPQEDEDRLIQTTKRPRMIRSHGESLRGRVTAALGSSGSPVETVEQGWPDDLAAGAQ